MGQTVTVKISSISRVRIMETIRVLIVGSITIKESIRVRDVPVVVNFVTWAKCVESWVEIVVVEAVRNWVVVIRGSSLERSS